MRKRIAIAVSIAASLALWAAVSPPSYGGQENSAPSPTLAVTALQAILPELPEPAVSQATEVEEVDAMIAEPVLEEADEQPSAPDPEPTAENQTESAPEPPAPLEPEIEAIGDNSADMAYVPGFGWIESQGPNQVEYAEDMYENGNKIGIMG